MPTANAQRVLREIYAALGRPSQQELPHTDVNAARIDAGMEVLRAIASNPQNPYYASLAALVTVAHGAFLPAHDGEPGIPLIVPFSGGTAREGRPRTPDQIDAYRGDTAEAPLYSGAKDGNAVAHDGSDSSGRMSPVACLYSLVNGRLKFTGYSAQVPLIQLTRTMADTSVPESYEATVVKLSIPRLVRPDDPLYALSREFLRMGQEDLAEIKRGSPEVKPVPNVVKAQKATI